MLKKEPSIDWGTLLKGFIEIFVVKTAVFCFIALMLPGLDMLRVFAMRILNNKNPFLPDRSHLHYLLLDKGLNPVKILIIFFVIILTPITLNQYTNTSEAIIIFFFVFLYSCLVIYSKKNFL